MGVERGAAGDRHRDRRRALREEWGGASYISTTLGDHGDHGDRV